MTETTPFFQSWGFWLCLGLVLGAIVGFFVAALCAVSGEASRIEERCEEIVRLNEEHKKGKAITTTYNFPICKGKPDRD